MVEHTRPWTLGRVACVIYIRALLGSSTRPAQWRVGAGLLNVWKWVNADARLELEGGKDFASESNGVRWGTNRGKWDIRVESRTAKGPSFEVFLTYTIDFLNYLPLLCRKPKVSAAPWILGEGGPLSGTLAHQGSVVFTSKPANDCYSCSYYSRI